MSSAAVVGDLGLDAAFWHVPAAGSNGVAVASRTSRPPFTLSGTIDADVVAHGDDNLRDVMALAPAYRDLAAILARGGAVEPLVAWARAQVESDRGWPARATLFLAVYYEHFAVHGTPCAIALAALGNPDFCAALGLGEAEIAAYAVVARGLIDGPVTPDDGLRYLLSRAGDGDVGAGRMNHIRRRNAAVNAIALARGLPRDKCYYYAACFDNNVGPRRRLQR